MSYEVHIFIFCKNPSTNRWENEKKNFNFGVICSRSATLFRCSAVLWSEGTAPRGYGNPHILYSPSLREVSCTLSFASTVQFFHLCFVHFSAARAKGWLLQENLCYDIVKSIDVSSPKHLTILLHKIYRLRIVIDNKFQMSFCTCHIKSTKIKFLINSLLWMLVVNDQSISFDLLTQSGSALSNWQAFLEIM